ncbi:MAG: histidine kinase [Nocardioidaceae bacterium]
MGEPDPTRRPAVAATVLLAAVCAGTLLDALHGRWLSDGPVAMLAAALVSLLVGATCPPVTAAVGTLAGAALLTGANQTQQPGSYTVVNDLTFFLVMLGCPALVGALWTSRTREIRQLQRLTRVRSEQRAADLRAARLEEQNRVASAVQHDVIQAMGAIVVQAVGAARATSSAQIGRALSGIELSAREALDQLRTHVGVLRAPDIEPVDEPAEPDTAPAPIPFGPLDLLVGAAALPIAIESVLSGAGRGPAWANVVVALLLALPLVVRRRIPLVATATFFAVAAIASAVLSPLSALVSPILSVLLVAFAVGAHVSGWARRVTGLAMVAAGILLVSWSDPGAHSGSETVLPTLPWIGLGFASGVAAAGRARRVRRLDRLLREIESGRATELRLATAEQRHTLASDLHDSVAAAMTVVCLHAAAAQQTGHDPDAVRSALATISDAARTGLAELRSSLNDLDGAAEADVGSTLDLERVVAHARAAGMEVRLRLSDMAALREDARTLVARVLRECLVNVTRYAPGARVEVAVVHDAGEVRVEVVDAGAAAEGVHVPGTPGTGHGLRGLDERLERIGGRLDFGPLEPRGFRVTARFPVVESVPA